jgi:hypothetical protein
MAIVKLGTRVFVAADAEGMIQKTGGHADLLVQKSFNATPIGISMSTIFNLGARFSRMNQF